MNIIKKSKKLSWLLRHGAIEAGLHMDAAGWVSIDEVVRAVRMTRGELAQVARENNKNRLELTKTHVRCSQGHSTEGMPVTQDALEASWARANRTAVLIHGTNVNSVASIGLQGIRPMRRTHVHLADSDSSRVGKRANVSVLVEVDPAGLQGLWVSPNGVYLTRFVPPAAIVGVHVRGRRAEAAEHEIRCALGLVDTSVA